MTWHTSVAFRVPATMEEDALFDITESLSEYSATATLDRDMQGGGISMFVDAETSIAAAERAVDLVTDLVGASSIVGIEVKTEEAFDAELERPTYPDVIGYAEIAKLAGVSRQRARQWADNPTFPVPVIETEQGPLRLKAAVEKWLETRNTRTGRPRAADNTIPTAS